MWNTITSLSKLDVVLQTLVICIVGANRYLFIAEHISNLLNNSVQIPSNYDNPLESNRSYAVADRVRSVHNIGGRSIHNVGECPIFCTIFRNLKPAERLSNTADFLRHIGA